MSHTFHRYKIGDEPVAGYRLTDHLGAGGFGEVWKANAPGGTEVALKIIDLTGQQGIQEFSSLRVVKKVRHPNLISLQAFWMKDESGQIIDEAGQAAASGDQLPSNRAADPKRQTQSVGIAATAFFVKPVELIIAMQLGSMSLHKRLEDCREQGLPGIPVAELLEYLEQSARGIDFLNKPIHDLGKGPVPIVHGDVKPHNILVVGDAAVVCDFGLARAVETLRKTSMAPVTVAYAAPESFKGKVTPTSDQYSLAITYAELRTGRLPFDETMTPYQVMEAHVTRTLDFSRLPEPERAVIMRGTDPDPEARWPSSRDMILAMRHAVAKTGELPLRPGEAAYSGGPTPTHAITARPKARDTDLPTSYPVDRHKETMHPGGNTPSELFSLQTAHSPPSKSRPGDDLAETAMLPPTGIEIPARKKSAGPIIGIAIAVVALVAGIIIVPKMLEKPPVTPPGGIANVPGGKGGESAEPESTDPNQRYIKRVTAKINAGQFAGAVDDLDKAPSTLEPNEKEHLQSRLKDKFRLHIDEQLQNRSFGLAQGELADALRGIGLTDADKKELSQKIRDAWLAQANEQFQNEQPSAAVDTLGNLLRRFENDRDALLLLARCQIRLQNGAAARETLTKLGKPADLPAERQPAVAGLALLAASSDDKVQPNWLNVLDEYLSYSALSKEAPKGSLELNTWEQSRLTNLREQIEQNVESQSKTLPADKRKEVLSKLEQLSSSPDVKLAKIRLALDDKQYAEARTAQQALAKSDNIPADAEKLKAEISALGLLINLRDPGTKAADFAAAMQESLKLYGTISTTTWSELCAASEALALGTQPALLDSALTMAYKSSDLDAASAQRYAKLLAAKLVAQTLQPTPPAADQLATLVQDCDVVKEAKIANSTVDAFHVECMLLQNSRDRQTMLALIDAAKPESGYTQYVQARVQRMMPQPDWSKVAGLLLTAYSSNSVKESSQLVAPFRRVEAAKLLIDAATKNRAVVSTTSADATLANPFGDGKNADAAFNELDLARKLVKGIESSGLKLTDIQQRELTTNLVLAAAWKTKPDANVAKAETDAVAILTDADLGTNALPVLYTVYRVNSAANGAPAVAIKAAQRTIELFQKQYPVADPQAVKLYNEILKPAIALADAQTASKTSPSDLDQFYAAAAEFIKHYQRATWPFADKQQEIEKLLTAAIKINPKAPKYFTARGAARISQTPPNIDGARGDADEAIKLDPNLPAAFALQGHTLIYRSRREPTREARLADLQQAIATCQKAVDIKADDDQRAMRLMYLSMAQLEKGTIETDQKIVKDLFAQSIENAQHAVELEKAYPDYAYTALGNAYEDMAWWANEEPEKNYRAAIDAFSEAINQNPSSPDPLIGRARCFYKAVSISKLDPTKALGRTAEEAAQSAIADLEQAKQLKTGLVEPDLWIGKANQQLGKYTEADESLGAAVKLADDQKLPERSLYIAEWARNAVSNPTLSAEERGKQLRERAEKLKAAPSVGGTSNAKQAAILIGRSLQAEKKIAEAIKEYDAALAEYEKSDKPIDSSKADGADASLFLDRAATRFALSETDWNLAAAENVIKDASRVIQLKAGPQFEAAANWYAANAKWRSVRSTSPSITQQKKQEYSSGAIDDLRNAIQLAPNDPSSIEWRSLGTRLATLKLTLPATKPEVVKSLGPEARKWINDAIEMAAKRPDWASQMSALQRFQSDLENALTAKGLPRS
jgi:serine/threonine protein kinase